MAEGRNSRNFSRPPVGVSLGVFSRLFLGSFASKFEFLWALFSGALYLHGRLTILPKGDCLGLHWAVVTTSRDCFLCVPLGLCSWLLPTLQTT